MIPLPSNPTVVLLIGDDDTIVGIATNVDPNLDVQATRSQRIFNELALGKPFVKGGDKPQS